MRLDASTPLKAAILSMGLLVSPSVQAQTSTTTSANAQTDSTSGTNSVVRDGKATIGATLSTTGGRYGTIADLVYDGTGAVQYALVERQGQLHPVPYSLLQFGTTGDANISTSSATLDAVSVDRNNLQSLYNNSFATQLRAAFGPNVARSFTASSGTNGFSTTGGDSASTTAARNQVFSLSGLLGGTINASNGEAGSISTVAINPNGTLAYAVGVSSASSSGDAAGTSRFAVPFAVAQLNSSHNGLSVGATTQALNAISVPQGSLPTSSDRAFETALTTAFGNQASSFAIGGAAPGLSQSQMNLLRRNDTFNSDPVVAAGNSSQAGFDAVAGAGDPRRGGVDATARSGDRASTSGSVATGTSAAGNMRGAVNGTTFTSRNGVVSANSTGTSTSGNNSPMTSGTAGTTTGSTTGTTASATTGTDGITRVGSADTGVLSLKGTTQNGTTGSGTAGGTVGTGVNGRLNSSDAGMLAQTTTGTSATGSTGGIVNLAQDVPAQSRNNSSGTLQMTDLLNYKVQAQDGSFGRVSDVVFDRNGNVQYLLGSYQGQTFPLPFNQSAFSGSNNNTLSYNVPISTLQQMAINPQQLPQLSNQAFTQRMQQVFGQSFGSGQTTSGYSPSRMNNQSGANGQQGAGTQSNQAGINNQGQLGNRQGSGQSSSSNSQTSGTTNQSGGTSGSGTGSASGAGSGVNQDNWTWPSNPGTGTGTGTNGRYPAPDPRSGRQDIRPNPFTKGPASGTGTGTGTGSTGTGAGSGTGMNGTGTGRYPAPDPRTGRQDIRPNPYTKSASGNTNNSGVGTGGRTQNPPPNGNNGTGTSGAGANGSSGASGSGTSGGSGSTGSGTTGGSGSSGTGGSAGSGS